MKRVLLALLLGLASLTSFAGLETGTYVNDLVSSNPPGSDPRSQGADHLRLVKSVLQATFPGMAGAADRIQTKAGNYTTVKNDNDSLVLYTATANNTLTAAATVGNGYKIYVYAQAADVTLVRSGADTINGATSAIVKRGRMAMVFSDGTSAYHTFEIAAGEGGAVPAGTIQAYAGSTAPAGWLPCDGTAVSRTTYAALFANVSTTWGVGDGSTTFNVPSLARKTLVGSGGVATGSLSNTVGSTGGAESHTITIAEMPAHTHPGSSASSSGSFPVDESIAGVFTGAGVSGTGATLGSQPVSVSTSVTVATQGGGTAISMYPPVAVILYIIKY